MLLSLDLCTLPQHKAFQQVMRDLPSEFKNNPLVLMTSNFESEAKHDKPSKPKKKASEDKERFKAWMEAAIEIFLEYHEVREE